MIKNTQSIRSSLPVSVLLALLAIGTTQADQNGVGYPALVEVFTATEDPFTGESTFNRHPGYRGIELHVYELDTIQRIETQLSEGLTADPEQSKQVVLQRFQQLNAEDRARMQQAAIGLAKAVQYGVDRYPAIVFDGGAVIYGVTDIHEALVRYRQWREGRQP